MIVLIESNRFGHLEVEPASARVARRFRRLMADPPRGNDCLLYLQSEQSIADFLAHLPRAKARDIRAGYTVRVRIPSDNIAAWCGV